LQHEKALDPPAVGKFKVAFSIRKGAVMSNRDGFFAMVSLALGAIALAGVLYTDEYSNGAQVGFGLAPAHTLLASASGEAALEAKE
jgi:hypothetical protein